MSNHFTPHVYHLLVPIMQSSFNNLDVFSIFKPHLNILWNVQPLRRSPFLTNKNQAVSSKTSLINAFLSLSFKALANPQRKPHFHDMGLRNFGHNCPIICCDRFVSVKDFWKLFSTQSILSITVIIFIYLSTTSFIMSVITHILTTSVFMILRRELLCYFCFTVLPSIELNTWLILQRLCF